MMMIYSNRIVDAIILTPDIQKDKYIDGCLRSLYGNVDLVSVVQSGEITNFADARNYAIYQHIIKHGKSKYILTIDSDERLVCKGIFKDMLSIINADSATISLIMPQYHLAFDNVHVAQDRVNRIFKSDLGIWYRGEIHESYSQDLITRGCTAYHIPLDFASIYHLGYDTNRPNVLYKAYRNLKQLLQNKIDFNTLHLIMKTLGVFGSFDLQNELLKYMLKHYTDEWAQKYLSVDAEKIKYCATLDIGGYNVKCKGKNDN